jgi:hypothetical protein
VPSPLRRRRKTDRIAFSPGAASLLLSKFLGSSEQTQL